MEYPIGRYLIPPVYKLWLGKVEGMENIPRKGPFILALNHVSYYETLLMYVLLIPALDIPMHALVNSRYWKNPVSSAILNWGKCIPVYVGKDHDPKKNEQALKKAESFLRKGHLLQIFPEGTRSVDGTLKQGKTGVARLAIRTGVPIIPIGVLNAQKVLPKNAVLPRFTKAGLNIGKPIIPRKKNNPTKQELESVTRTVMQKIALLTSQRYAY